VGETFFEVPLDIVEGIQDPVGFFNFTRLIVPPGPAVPLRVEALNPQLDFHGRVTSDV